MFLAVKSLLKTLVDSQLKQFLAITSLRSLSANPSQRVGKERRKIRKKLNLSKKKRLKLKLKKKLHPSCLKMKSQLKRTKKLSKKRLNKIKLRNLT